MSFGIKTYLKRVGTGSEEAAESLGGDEVTVTLNQGQADRAVLPDVLQRFVRHIVVLLYCDVSPCENNQV